MIQIAEKIKVEENYNQKAIEIIAQCAKITSQEAVAKAQYDQTFINCKITKVLDNDNYEVFVNGAKYIIKCTEDYFSVDDLVTVIVPRNNWNNLYIDLNLKGDDWKPPKDWLKLPAAEKNEITLLVNDYEPLYISFNNIGYTVDWGDGNISINPNSSSITHTYTKGSGHLISDGTSQFIVTIKNISVNNPISTIYTQGRNIGLLLASVNIFIPINGSYLFGNNKALCQVDILSNTIVGENMFRDCYSLKKINLSNSITVFKAGCFYGCISLFKINIPKKLSIIESGQYSGGAFVNCYNLKTLDFSKTAITSVPYGCFSYCQSLQKIVLPSKVSVIENQAFYNCHSLYYINISKGCTIANDAFQDCDSLHPYGHGY